MKRANLNTLGCPQSGGGLLLSPDEARWLRELFGRLQIVQSQKQISILDMQQLGNAGTAKLVEATEHYVRQELAQAIVSEVMMEEQPDRLTIRGECLYIRHGLPPKPFITLEESEHRKVLRKFP